MRKNSAPESLTRVSPHYRQGGLVLGLVLFLLVALAVAGVAMQSGTFAEEARISDVEQEIIAFEVAESAITTVWQADIISNALLSDSDNVGSNPIPIMLPGDEAEQLQHVGMIHAVDGVDFEGTLTVQYCGEATPMGTDLNVDESTSAHQFVQRLFEVNSVVQVANTIVRADHLQRGAIASVKTGRAGACLPR